MLLCATVAIRVQIEESLMILQDLSFTSPFFDKVLEKLQNKGCERNTIAVLWFVIIAWIRIYVKTKENYSL